MDFIGIGAQKAGTSWAYTCLYEHPEICAPIKEIHYFSRPRFEKGKEWYESYFKRCAPRTLKGEFSTSYLYSKEAPERIHALYPHVKLIAILRNPVDRAYSQYRNAIKAGEIPDTESFESYADREKSVIEQGKYAEQLKRYYSLFAKEQILVLIYEDIKKDPVAFMRRIYTFLGIDSAFISSMVHSEINVARTPKHVRIDRFMHYISEALRKAGLDRFVHLVRKSGLTDLIRSLNTKEQPVRTDQYDRAALQALFREDVRELTLLCGRDMVSEWHLT